MSLSPPRATVGVGDPSPGSRTLAAATWLATQLAGAPDLVVDFAHDDPAAYASWLADAHRYVRLPEVEHG